DAWPGEDVEGAKALLAQAGFPGGQGLPELSFAYPTGARTQGVAQYLQGRWKDALGVSVRLTALDANSTVQWLHSENWTGGGDVYMANWFTDFQDPYNWYSQIWSSPADPTAYNQGWKDAHYDQVVQQAAG